MGKKEKINRFKRRKTSRSEIQHETLNVNEDKNENEDDAETEKLKSENDAKDTKKKKGLLSAPAEFEGFLLRKIGHKTDKIGEKIYFRLTNDQLEFSKIDGM